MTRDDLKALLAPLPDVSILGLTLYGEARGEPIEGIVAAGNVIHNRVTDAKRRWGQTYRDVCLHKAQFSCWNLKDPNLATLVHTAKLLLAKQPTPDLEQCAWVALGIDRRALVDNTRGANHYHTAGLTPRPAWAQPHVPVKQISRHVFYRL